MKNLPLSVITILAFVTVLTISYIPTTIATCAKGPNGTQICTTGPIPVTVNIPTHVYVAGDMLDITGTVDRNILQNQEPLSISIYDSKRNLVRGPEILPEGNGTYSFSLQLTESFGPTGQYEIWIGQGKTVDTGTWFMFIAKPYQLRVNGLDYSINYKITSGQLDKISLNKTENSLTAYISDTMNGGYLTLQLPRPIIDARSPDGGDSQFDVLVGYPPNMEKANFTEINHDWYVRTLQISYPYDPLTNSIGDWYIKIIGTETTQISDSQSPLKQFQSGIPLHYIQCYQGRHLIIKSEDGTPACVTIKTGIGLVMRGWATTFGTGYSAYDYDTTCDHRFLAQKSGIAVLYMPTNSLGKICLRYSNPNGTPQSVYTPRIFDVNDPAKPPGVRIWTYFPLKILPKDNVTTVAYFIKTGNQTGFYGLSLPSCFATPFAVGYNNDSKIVASDFGFVGATVSCPVKLFDIQIDGLTGIGVKYIPYP